MITVTYLEAQISCATAIKGSDYIHLLNDEGIMIAAFDGIVDFTNFSISGGSWTSPASTAENVVAVIKEDGTTCACGIPLSKFHKNGEATLLTESVQYGTELPSTGSEGQLFFLVI